MKIIYNGKLVKQGKLSDIDEAFQGTAKALSINPKKLKGFKNKHIKTNKILIV